MEQLQLPAYSRMLDAFQNRDASFDGVFYTAVRTTGIFCRPTCPAKKPLEQNIEFFPTVHEALFAGYRPCKRCHPLEAAAAPPEWVRPLLAQIEAEPDRRWKDRDLSAMGMHPDRVRRWFKQQHNMTFQAYSRARRLSSALGQIRLGAGITSAAMDSGYDSVSGFSSAVLKARGQAPSLVDSSGEVSINRLSTPLGQMIACASETALLLLEFVDRRMIERQLNRVRKWTGAELVPGENKILRDLESELVEYFAGRLSEFKTPLETTGTQFQEIVWTELQQIPYGSTVSYADLARNIDRPTAVRAVANANGHNRIAILIPCHRVIGADGTLTGYGGGLWRKQRLLDIENNQLSLGLT
jgi:AraC family transcriptional regulator, regulatory protein of adaptative response / methylated-DNA-[protein]-cysteine methyltransferase